MKLLKLNLINFQGIKSLSYDFDGKNANIYGDNATGKTTIYNGVTWLLFDKASTAAKNFTPKTKSADGDVHHLEHSAEAVLQADDGRIITLKRTFKEVYKKKRGAAHEEFDGHTICYEVDGVPVKEKEFSAVVESFCGNQEKAKILTMPDYFSEQLSWEDRRKLLLEICGDICDDDIIAANPDLQELPRFLLQPGTDKQFYTTDEYRKIALLKRSAINKKLDNIPNRIDEATLAIPAETEGLDAEKIDDNIAALNTEIKQLSQEKAALNVTAAADLQRAKADYKAQLAECRAAYIRQAHERNADIENAIIAAKREVMNAKLKSEDITNEIRRTNDKKEYMKHLREQLLQEYNEVFARSWDSAREICPTCGQALPTEKVEKMQEDFNVAKSNQLAEINQRGQKEASKQAIAELENKLSDLQSELEATEESKRMVAEKVDKISSKLLPITPFEDTEEYAALAAEIAEFDERINCKCENITAAEVALDAKIKAAEDALKIEQDNKFKLSVADIQRRRINELEQEEEQLAAEAEELEKGLYLCDLFTKTKVAALSERINGKFKNVRFRLFQEQLNGGVKDDCEVIIPSESGNLVPYAFANNAARINAGLEIIDTISAHWNIRMPVFVDNAESVTNLIDTANQTIRLVVSEIDKKLRLEICA